MRQLTAILRAKLRMARHVLASVRRESKLKVALVSLSTVLLWLGALQVSLGALHWLQVFGGEAVGPLGFAYGNLITARLLSSLALVWFVLLGVSSVLVGFATLFRSPEVTFLAASPLGWRALFLARFFEAFLLGSWASAFLGSPLLVAYGRVAEAPATFYLGLLLVFPFFALLPAALGTLAAMMLARLLPLLGRVGIAAVGASAVGLLYLLARQRLGRLMPAGGAGLDSLVALLGSAEHPALPSQWAVTAVLELAGGSPRAALPPLLLLAAAALAAVALAAETARWIFYPAWSELSGGARARRRGGPGKARLERLLTVLPEPYRSLTLKDLRLFWRDPAQWSQFLIFFGILAVYAATMRRTSPAYDAEFWQALIALLNGAVGLLILATLTTRFVFPLISLEGRRVWMLGLAPLTWRQIQRQKLWLGVASTSGFTLLVTAVTSYRLQLGWQSTAVCLFTVAAANLALVGLAVGLGCLYPNFAEDNPARIVSGLGGTLNFILSMLFVVFAAGVQAALLQWRWLARWAELEVGRGWAMAVGLGLLAAVSAVSCWLPLRLGLKRLERLEF